MPASEPCSCPCNSGNSFATCCEPYVTGKKAAPTAESLMRSRYCAYHLGKAEYLVATLHVSRQKPSDLEDLTQSFTQTEWHQLSILSTQAGKARDNEGMVEFIACFSAPGSDDRQALCEKSRFVKEDGRWFYVDGDHKDIDDIKFPRNQACWCGNPKKFKQCHGR